ncbi:hypothetical protein [Streptomyces sp. NBC_00057]|uniref:hypothetical protein n=1 Tax=Streptomyces sp. NBC_00057 TaxID=2975634 RepID=UPI003248EF4F
MAHHEAGAALEETEFDRRQNLRHEEMSDNGGRGEAVLVEWQCIVQLLARTGLEAAPKPPLKRPRWAARLSCSLR